MKIIKQRKAEKFLVNTHHLDFTVNILVYLPYHTSIPPAIRFIFYAFQSKFQTLEYLLLNISACMSLTSVQYLFIFLFCLLVKINIQCNMQILDVPLNEF